MKDHQTTGGRVRETGVEREGDNEIWGKKRERKSARVGDDLQGGDG